MTERPIIFSGPMVRAILAGTKTQTRRVIKPRKHFSLFDGTWTDDYVLDPGNASWRAEEVRFAVGDRLWVRETACIWGREVFYQTNEPGVAVGLGGLGKWRPSIHMPRWASRLTLTVTDVRVQRLQEITGEDAIAEGMFSSDFLTACPDWLERGFHSIEVCRYHDLWNSINEARGFGWSVNPWVAVVSFTVEKRNIDSAGLAG